MQLAVGGHQFAGRAEGDGRVEHPVAGGGLEDPGYDRDACGARRGERRTERAVRGRRDRPGIAAEADLGRFREHGQAGALRRGLLQCAAHPLEVDLGLELTGIWQRATRMSLP